MRGFGAGEVRDDPLAQAQRLLESMDNTRGLIPPLFFFLSFFFSALCFFSAFMRNVLQIISWKRSKRFYRVLFFPFLFLFFSFSSASQTSDAERAKQLKGLEAQMKSLGDRDEHNAEFRQVTEKRKRKKKKRNHKCSRDKTTYIMVFFILFLFSPFILSLFLCDRFCLLLNRCMQQRRRVLKRERSAALA